MNGNRTIRAARVETDLPGIVSLINPYEIIPVSVDQVRSWFEHNPPGRVQLRLVSVDENDAVTGYSCVLHAADTPDYHFYAWLVVDPALRCRGIGSALWDASLAFLMKQGATRLASEVDDNDPLGLAFAEQRGFTIDRHLFHSTLHLADFDETPFLPGIAEVEAQGIRFCSLADFPDTPENRRKLFELNTRNVLDMPNQDGRQPTYADFEKFVINAPWFNPQGQLLAVDGESWVGLAAISITEDTRSAYNLHTGVLRAYRGRKIAQSLKVLAARYAREHGALSISTDNDSLNAPILAINQKMGYQPQPGKYLLVRWLESAERAES